MLVRSSYILPSNAPPLHGLSLHHIDVSGVLEEQSGNPQPSVFDRKSTTYHKPVPQYLIENQAHGPQSVVTYPSGPPTVDQEDAWIEREAAYAQQRMRKSEHYRNYRDKQPKKDGKDADETWPHHVEFAMWKALVKYRHMGKAGSGSEPQSKRRGRNELIAESIYKWTGVFRKRKQISSHLQVLRDMIDNDQYMEQYFPEKGRGKSPERTMRSRQFKRSRQSRTKESVHKENTLPEPPRVLLPPASLQGDALGSPRLMPHKFDMFVCQQGNHSQRLHTFAQFTHESQLPDLHLSEFRRCEGRYSTLKELSNDNAAALQIIQVEASVELMVGTTPGAELGIDFEFRASDDLTAYHGAPCNTLFFENGTLADRGFVEGKVNCRNTGLNVPFGSGFWARKVTHLGSLLREAKQRRTFLGDEDSLTIAMAKETALRYEERVREEISRLTAVQEIFTLPLGSEQPRKTLLIFWSFHQFIRNGTSQSMWRNVLSRTNLARNEHTKNSFNIMSAITMGADPNDRALTSLNSTIFNACSNATAMSPHDIVSDHSGEGREISEQTYSGSHADYADSAHILINPHTHHDGVAYPKLQPAVESQRSARGSQIVYVIGKSDPTIQTPTDYAESGVASYGDHTGYNCLLGGGEVENSPSEINNTHFSSQSAVEYSLHEDFETASHPWSVYSVSIPGMFSNRDVVSASQPVVASSTAKYEEVPQLLKGMALDESANQKEE